MEFKTTSYSETRKEKDINAGAFESGKISFHCMSKKERASVEDGTDRPRERCQQHLSAKLRL